MCRHKTSFLFYLHDNLFPANSGFHRIRFYSLSQILATQMVRPEKWTYNITRQREWKNAQTHNFSTEFFNSSCFTQQHTSNVLLPWKPRHLGGCLTAQELLLEGPHKAALLLVGLEATMTPFAGGVNELQGDLLHVATTEGCQQWLQREVEQWQVLQRCSSSMGIVTSTGKQLGLGVAQPLVILVTHSFASRSTKMNKNQRLSSSITPRQDGQTKLSQCIRFTETTAY